MTPDDLRPGKIYFFDMEGYGPGGHKIVEGIEGWAGSQHERFHRKPTMYVGPSHDFRGMYDFLFYDKVIVLGVDTIRFNLCGEQRN